MKMSARARLTIVGAMALTAIGCGRSGEMDIADVFDYPSIRELAAFMAEKRQRQGDG